MIKRKIGTKTPITLKPKTPMQPTKLENGSSPLTGGSSEILTIE